MKKRAFILDTDWWTDCDDIVALRLLCRLHKKGDLCLKGVCANNRMEHTAASLSAMLTAEHVDVPIGIAEKPIDEATVPKLTYQAFMKDFPHKVENKDCLNGVSFYRKLLAEATEKIDIIGIGFQTVLADLLQSASDAYSPLNGTELVRQKVNTLWAMAGKWDEHTGKEYNFTCCPESRLAGAFLCAHWPTPIVYLGFEVGESVITGKNLPQNDFLKQCMTVHGSENGRSSWDPMTVYLAYVGSAEEAGYKQIFGTAAVNPNDGSNTFSPAPNGKHSYVIKQMEDSYYSEQIDSLLQ